MVNEWKEILLEDVADEVTVGFVGSMISEYIQDGIPFLRSKNVNPYRIRWDDMKYISKEFHSKIKKSSLHPGDVVIVRTGKPGTATIIPDTINEANCSDLVIVRPGSKLDKGFLVYYLNSAAKDHINAHLVGAVQQHFNVGAAKKLSILLPPLPEQKTIAHILGSLDDKIELNKRMNATLEGMAQALFKSWFVDFDPVIDNALAAGNPIPEEFTERAAIRRKALNNGSANRETAKNFPDSFQLTESMGWIPEGWKVQSLETMIELIGGGTPKTSIDEYWNGRIPWFSVVDAPNNSDVFVIDTKKKITALGLNNSSTKILRKGSTIITARGTVGKCALLGKEMAMNQSCYGIYGVNGISDIYTYYTIREFVADLQQRGHGSVFNTITRETFKSINVSFGKTKLTHSFDRSVKPLLERILSNLFQNFELATLRDTLLPKLISGEICIPQTKQIQEEKAT